MSEVVTHDSFSEFHSSTITFRGSLIFCFFNKEKVLAALKQNAFMWPQKSQKEIFKIKKTNKEHIKNASKRFLNVPNLRKV